MQINIRDISRESKEIIYEGEKAKQVVQKKIARVNKDQNELNAARRKLEFASKADKEGNTLGDVESAKAELDRAELRLRLSKNELALAESDLNRNIQQKKDYIKIIRKGNDDKRDNLKTLAKLKQKSFAHNSAAASKDMADRINEGENVKSELEKSLNIDSHPDYVVSESVGTTELTVENAIKNIVDQNVTTMKLPSKGSFSGEKGNSIYTIDDDAIITYPSKSRGENVTVTGKELKALMRTNFNTDKVTYTSKEPDFTPL